MNRNDLGIFIENIDFELDKIRNNEAYINNKSYFGLDKDLLSYIRNLEQALDEIEKYIENHKRESKTRIYGLEIPEFIFNGNIEDIEEIIQKAKGDVKNEN